MTAESGQAQEFDGQPAVRTDGLTRRFGDLVAVDHVDLVVPTNRIFGLLGPNGAGKSTLIKMLTTLLPPTGGGAEVAGFDVARAPVEVRRRIGYVPQLLSADGALTGFENLMLSAKLYDIPRSERRGRIAESLAFMGLSNEAGTLVRKYSGGMIRRLEIAQSMLHRPAVLFLDEPTVGLDPVARRAVWEKLAQLRRERRTTVLMTTHDMEEAEALCDFLAILHRGKTAASGTPEELRAAVGPDASLDDVFVRVTGAAIEAGGGFREAREARRVARRLGG